MSRRRSAAIIAVIAVALLAGAVTGGVLAERDAAPVAAPRPPGIPSAAFEVVVESVHDGDTLRATVDSPNDVITDTASTRIRLLGIDTPELSPEVECGADAARESLVELAPVGSVLWAAPDREVRDRYGRHLLYLWTPDGRFVNAELVARGDARVEIYAPNDLHAELLRDLESRAMADGVGRWTLCR